MWKKEDTKAFFSVTSQEEKQQGMNYDFQILFSDPFYLLVVQNPKTPCPVAHVGKKQKIKKKMVEKERGRGI